MRKNSSFKKKKTMFNSEYQKDIDVKLRRRESRIEDVIKTKLKNKYPKDTPPYHRLTPDKVPRGTVQNDACAPGIVTDATVNYLKSQATELPMDEIRRVSADRKS